MMLSLLLLVASMGVMAQDKRMITVHNGNNLQVFYGDCFAAAVKAAQSGDTLTLSKGSFSGVTIDKPLVIQGAGGYSDRSGTNIDGNIIVKLPEDDAEGLVIEGLYIGMRYPTYDYSYSNNNYLQISSYINKMIVRRCLIYRIMFNQQQTDSCRIEQCKTYELSGMQQCRDLFVTNSIVTVFNSPGTTGSVMADHCIISNLHDYVICRNSYVYYHYTATEGTPLYNCIYVQQGSGSSQKIDCINVSNFGGCFTNGYSWDDTKSGVPVDPESTISISTDGTQIGIYGGTLGYSPYSLNPQITNSEIAREVDADGKLSVKITVEAAKE